MKNTRSLFLHAGYSTSYADPGLKMWETFALATVLTLKLDPDRLLIAIHSQFNLKSPQTLATANVLTHFIISIALLENVPPEARLHK
jgi:hypothetical protein